MDGVGPSEELQEVEEELRKTKGDGKEQEEDGEECDATNGSGGEGDLEKGNNGVSKLPDQNLAAENLKVFTQVSTNMNKTPGFDQNDHRVAPFYLFFCHRRSHSPFWRSGAIAHRLPRWHWPPRRTPLAWCWADW